MRNCSICSAPGSSRTPPRTRCNRSCGTPSSAMARRSMTMASTCTCTGTSSMGRTSGQRGSLNGASSRGRSSRASARRRLCTRTLRVSNGSSAASSVKVPASNLSVPMAHAACAVATQSPSRCIGMRSCTPRKVSGPARWPLACVHVSVLPAGNCATACRSSRSRPLAVYSSHPSSAATANPNSSSMMPARRQPTRRLTGQPRYSDAR